MAVEVVDQNTVSQEVEVTLEVQLQANNKQKLEVVGGGDLSNAHDVEGIATPVFRCAALDGVCSRCVGIQKDEWGDEEACKEAMRRSTVLQHVSNHTDIRRRIKGGMKLPAFVCPYCLKLIDAKASI